MKKLSFSLLLLIVFSVSGFAQVDKILGRWKTIDDKDGSAKSIVLIFKATNGNYYGKIEKLFKEPNKLCTECTGANKNQPVLGMLIINGMKEVDGILSGGTILDPKNGKVYKCNISIEKNFETLIVRGSLDSGGFIGRSQKWIKIK